MTLDIDWAQAWREEQQLRRAPDDATYWDGRAESFAKTCGTSPYAGEFIKRACIAPDDTVFDMGCGSGTLSLPLAEAGHHVYACDFSRGMLDLLAEAACDRGVADLVHPALLAWDDEWSGIDIPICDIAIASRSIATADMQASLVKLDAMARRRVCITLATGTSPRVDDVLLRAIGRTPPSNPDCVFAYNILWQMGIKADVSYIESARKDAFESFEAAIDKNCDILRATAEERTRLIEYSAEHLHEVEDADGSAHWEYDHPRVTSWAFLAWDK